MGPTPKETVQQRIGVLLVGKIQNGELLPEEEAELASIRSSVQRRMLKYSAVGLAAGILAATPFRNRAKARLITGSVGMMAAIQYAWYTSTDPALKKLLSIRTPIGNDIRRIFEKEWPDSPLLAEVRSQTDSGSEGWQASDEHEGANMQESIVGDTIDQIDPDSVPAKGKRRNQWGDPIEDDK